MKIYAHRGFSSKFAENTASAFISCKDLDIEGIEIDVQYTMDKKVVVIHDEFLNRLCKVNKFVKDMTWSEMKDLKILNSNDSPLLLEEYVDIIKDANLTTNVELKTSIFDYVGIEKDVYEIFRSRNILDKLLISSFNHNSLLNFRKITKDVPIAALEAGRLIEPWEYLSKYNIDFFHPLFITMDKETVEKLHDKGIGVNVWTVNEKEHFEFMKEIGVDGVITNYPDLKFDK